MTDNEIIKALECCKTWNCEKCINRNRAKTATNCRNELVSEIFDLINRQKAEISKLQSDQYAIDKFARDLCKERMLKGKAIADFKDLQDYIKKEKTEAIKKFANRLKCGVSITSGIITCEDINRLLKEMTEGENV